jgi:hypothetical protein
MALTKVKLIADGTIVQSNLHASHGITTADIGENASYLYYTDARARAAVSVSGNALSYNSSTGVITSNFEESPTFTGTVKASTYLINTASAAGIGASLGDINGAELGPGYLIISRDDTANAKQISFYKNNVEHSYLETTSSGLNIGGGNVGIGTTTPDEKLVVNGSIGLSYDGTNSYQGIKRTSVGNEYYCGTTSTGTDEIHTFTGSSSAKKLVILESGNVGIGTTAPNDRLHIVGNLFIENGSPEITFETGSTHYNWQIAAQENVNAALEFSVGSQDADASNDTFTPKMIILQNGNVGIGTTSPSADLEVYTDAGGGNTLRLNTNFGGGNTVDINPYITGVNNGGMEIKLAGSQKLVMNPSGDVGIGTTSPSQKLEVSGAIKSISTGAAQLILNGDTNNSGDTGQEDAIIDFLGDGNPGIYGYRINTENWSGQTALHFQEYINGAYTSRLYINKDGNVGIGTTSPSTPLDISSNSNSSDNIVELINTKYGSTNTAGETGILFGWSNHSAARITAFKEGTVNRTGFKIIGEAGYNVPTTIATFRSTGRVGIGTTSPSGLLTIKGTGDAIRVESTNTGAGGAQIDLLHFTTSPADGDTFAMINMGGYYTGTTSVYGTSIKSIWTDVSARNADLTFSTNNSGTLTETMRINSAGNIIIKDDGNIYASTNNSTVNSGIYFGGSDNTLRTYTNDIERMRISSNGTVQINSTTTQNAGKLQIDSGTSENGGILDIAGSGWYRYYTRVCRNATSASAAGYWHIKTNIPANGNVMFLAKFYGYIYGSAQILDLQHAGYAYSGTSSVINQSTTNNGSDPNASSAIYISANGSKVTFRIAFGSGSNFSTYFSGVMMDMAFPSPAGQGHDFEIEAQTFSTSTTVY